MGITTAPARGLRVAELAEAVGLSPDTIRYYERAGLLPPPQRTAAGYRAYDADAVERLKFIQGAQRLGLRLRDIADLLTIRDTGVCPCEPAERLLRRRLAELDAEMTHHRGAAHRDGGDGRRVAFGRLPTAEPPSLVPTLEGR